MHPVECQGCRFKKPGLQEQRAHSEECRQRRWEGIGASEPGEARRKEEERVNRKLKEHAERRKAAYIGEEAAGTVQQEEVAEGQGTGELDDAACRDVEKEADGGAALPRRVEAQEDRGAVGKLQDTMDYDFDDNPDECEKCGKLIQRWLSGVECYACYSEH